MKRNILKAVEWGLVAVVTAILFVVARKAAIEFRGNTLWGGEILILMLPAFYAMAKCMIRDICLWFRGE